MNKRCSIIHHIISNCMVIYNNGVNEADSRPVTKTAIL